MIQLDRRMGGSGAALAARTTFEYDLNSRLRFVRELTEPTGNDWATSEARYTPTGRLERVIDPALDADVFSYDARDWLFSATDGAARRTEYVYDPAGRLTCERRAVGVPSQEQASRSLAYAFWDAPTRYRPARGSNGDAACTQVTANYDTNVSLDAYGRVRTTTFPDGTTTVEERNLAGEVTNFTNRAGQQHAMSYDNAGRVLTRTTPEGTFAFQYNRAGEQTRAAFDPAGAEPERWTQFVFDGFGRLISEERWDGLDVGYEYDPASNRTAIVWPDDWRAEYVYDPLNRLVEVRGGAAGSVVTLARYQYDARSRRTSAAFGPALGAPVSSIAYLWEIDNDLDTLTHVFNGASVVFDHGYDGSGRLTSTAVSNDDWLWRPAIASSESYGAANVLDQYPTVAGQTLTWDTRGNLASWDGLALTHDSANRLTSAARTGVFNAAYAYDGLDRRIARSGSGDNVAQVRFVHAGAEEIAEYHPTTNTVLRRYVPGAGTDQPVAYIEYVNGPQLYYYHQDRLGNIVALANASGQLADRYLYTPYGVEEPLVSTGQPFRYNARRFDAESALYHYRARMYAPQLGRFLETDPLLYADQMNLYAYVGNDPLNGRDPTGRYVESAIDIAFIAADAADIAQNGLNWENGLSMGANVVGLLLPGATGGGLLVRGGFRLADRANDANRAADAARATCCFVAGTLVQTSEGLRPIEEIEVGELVLARDVDTGETAYKPVTNLVRRHERVIWEVALNSPEGAEPRFETTDDHPWWIAGIGWRRTEELRPGMAVVTLDGRGMVVAAVRETARVANTYNLTVADFETYFVGEAGVLVHNCPGAYGDGTRQSAYGNPSSSRAAREAREAGEGQPCPSCGREMRSGTETEPWAQHDPALSDHYRQHGGSEMTAAERRAYARSEESLAGSNCATCQRREGAAQRERYRERDEQ